MLKFIAIILLVTSCSSVEKVILPDGREGHALECGSKTVCYEEARKICNGNYEIIESGITGGDHPNVTYSIACKK